MFLPLAPEPRIALPPVLMDHSLPSFGPLVREAAQVSLTKTAFSVLLSSLFFFIALNHHWIFSNSLLIYCLLPNGTQAHIHKCLTYSAHCCNLGM
jgi:hypothetical protein